MPRNITATLFRRQHGARDDFWASACARIEEGGAVAIERTVQLAAGPAAAFDYVTAQIDPGAGRIYGYLQVPGGDPVPVRFQIDIVGVAHG
ncbi:MAG TPA: hypothetical protein VGK41_01295 [Solirubrobacterales bacterium]